MAGRRITILGSGFGALSAVRELRARGCKDEITRVSPRSELHYLPGIIWIPSGLRTREQLIDYARRAGSTGHHPVGTCRMGEDEAMAMIVRGFVEPIARELPMEYALELNRLIELQMEGAVG